MPELVTIRTFDQAIDAHLTSSKLESEGIVPFLFDEHLISLDPLLSNLLGGIKLKVKPSDVDRAKAIIAEVENRPVTDEDDNIVTCPSCGSQDLYTGFNSVKGLKGIFSMIISVVLFIYPMYLKNVLRCKKCGKEFEK